MVISTSQVNRKTWRKGLESNHFWSTGEFGVPFKKYQKVVVQQTQLQNMLVKKGSSSPSFGMNIKQIETTSWDSGLRRSLRFFQWKKTALNVSKKHPNPAFMISTLKEIDSGNRWSLWLLKKLSCILLLKKKLFQKNLKKMSRRVTLKCSLILPEKHMEKPPMKPPPSAVTTQNHPKPIGMSYLQHPCDADDAKRLQTAHTCHLMTAVWAKASRRTFPRGKKMAAGNKRRADLMEIWKW